MVTVWYYNGAWQVVFDLPPLPEDPGWFVWWYPLVWAPLWLMGTGVAAKLVYGWDTLSQWTNAGPVLWPGGMFMWVPNRLTKRYLVWRDYRKNCKLTAKAKKDKSA